MPQLSLQGVGKTVQGRTGAWEAMREVDLDIAEGGFIMDPTADSVAYFQLATDQLRGIGRLAWELTPAQAIWPDAFRTAAPGRVKIQLF